MEIQWFPGHMARTRQMLRENLKLIDVVIEMLDSRIPLSSRNPEIDIIIGAKPKILVLNKSDLADESISKDWNIWYTAKGYNVIFIDSIKGSGINRLKTLLHDMFRERVAREKIKGRIFRPIRAMVAGIPNVGKSAFINKIAGGSAAVTGDKPGITKGKQWIKLNPGIELLDMPGILWPKFDDKQAGINLAITGAIKDEIMDIAEIASILLQKLSIDYPEMIKNRYKLESVEGVNGNVLLENAARNRGCIISGGQMDLNRIAAIVLNEFRGGKIGRITLERPEI